MKQHKERSFKHFFNYAVYRGIRHELAEEFAQEALLRIFNGQDSSTNNLFVDWLRLSTGKKGGESYEVRQKLTNPITGVDPDLMDIFMGFKDEPKILAGQSLLRLDLFSRAVVVLLCKWGFNLKEVGEVFGMSEASISQFTVRLTERVARQQK